MIYFYSKYSVEWFLKILLLISILCLFVPFSPKMPATGVDPSWAMGLNQAVAQGLSFGKDILFTLGPYSSIYTKMYHPSTDFMMVGGSLYLAISYWLCLVFLMKGAPWRWIAAFGVLLFGMIYSRDSLLFSYPLIVGLTCYNIIYAKQWELVSRHYLLFMVTLFFVPFGLLPLIKGTLLILCVIVVALCSILFAVYRQRILALICLAAPVVSIVFFWLGSGQLVANLPGYIITSLSLASGFTEAMALDGDDKEIHLYLAAAGFILFTIVRQKKPLIIAKLFVLCIFFIFLFLSFKTGFTRHYGHAFIPGTSILMAALLLPFVFNSKLILPVIIFSIYTWGYINGHYAKISIHNDFISNYTSAWYAFKKRIHDKNWLKQDFEVITNYLKEQVAFPLLQGTTDIYSYDQSYLISSKINWSPRPIFQSYSVFTSSMALANRKHLMSKQRPDNIIFKVEPIDGRVPSLDDGASWPLLLEYYKPTHLTNYLFLHKKAINKMAMPMKLIASEKHVFTEVVNLPDIKQPIFAEIEIKPTLFGVLATIFYKPTQLTITFELQNDTKKQYRMIAIMAKSGFLLSPLIENTDEFKFLYDKQNLLENKKVKSFVIASNKASTWQWNVEYLIHFKQMCLAHSPCPATISGHI